MQYTNYKYSTFKYILHCTGLYYFINTFSLKLALNYLQQKYALIGYPNLTNRMNGRKQITIVCAMSIFQDRFLDRLSMTFLPFLITKRQNIFTPIFTSFSFLYPTRKLMFLCVYNWEKLIRKCCPIFGECNFCV